jgi:hypothetical protein
MSILRIEHAVRDFDAWKTAFDSDPVGRERGGVRRYEILRPIDDPNDALIDLEFDSSRAAEAFLEGLRELWSRVEGTVMVDPKAQILDTVERKEY